MADSKPERSQQRAWVAVCKLLASKGIVVVLTARDEKRGLEAIDKLKLEYDLSDHVIFHQLDVSDPASVLSLADFVKRKFGKLDILMNNAGVTGAIIDADALRASSIEKNLPEGLATEVFCNAKSLTEEKVDEVSKEFLNDFKEGSLNTKGWPVPPSAYAVSKVALNAYTRIIAANYPMFLINCVCPGFFKTDVNRNTGFLTPEEGAEGPMSLALLPDGGPSGRFFQGTIEATF